jgi:Ankyrin repeats (3 copies)
MNDHPREPQPPEDVDEFYRRASALDPSRPGDHVRRSVLAHAERLASVRARSEQKRPRWRPAVFGTLAAAVLAGLVIAPHWLRVRSPAAAAAPPTVSAKDAAQRSDGTAANLPAPAAAPAPAAPAPASAAPASAAASTVRAYSPAARAGSRDSSTERPGAASDADVAGEVSNRGTVTNSPVSPSLAEAVAPRAAAAPVARSAQLAPAESLQQAADVGDLAALRRLLGANADVDARDAQGRTALMHAVLHGQTQAVELLLAAGANPLAADNDGRTALQAAEAGGRPAIVEALQHSGAH